MIDKKRQQIILEKIGALIEMRAKMNCPVDLGPLRASITHEVNGNVVRIFTNLPYADDIEYGKPPEILSESEKGDLTKWSERHNLPAYSVIKKIEREGIKVGTVEQPLKTPSGYRPFLRPALFQSLPNIKKIIKNELGN